MSPKRPSDTVREELSASADVSWTVVSSLLVADQLTNRALEEHLLRLHYDGSGSVSEIDHIDETIERHEEIIDQLELAKELLADHQQSEKGEQLARSDE